MRLKIFVSSPGDVAEERELTRRVIQRLGDEFSQSVILEPVLWEHEPLLATSSFQPQIADPALTDIVVCILWSRLGSPLPKEIRREDGKPYSSGTEYEFDLAHRSWSETGKPEILFYRKNKPVSMDLDDDEQILKALAEKKRVKHFIQDRFIDSEDGTLKAAFHEFDTLAEFEQVVEEHLRKLIRNRLPEQGAGGGVFVGHSWKSGSPFRGLQVFEYEHAGIYFGRTAASGEILHRLRRQAADGAAFVLVLGMSGCGKSSLVRAGVLPLLTEPGVIEGVAHWKRATLRPADGAGDLFRALSRAITLSSALPGIDGAAFDEQLHTDPAAARRTLEAELEKSGNDAVPAGRTCLALVIDQFEEIFTYADVTEAERNRFAEAIEVIAKSPDIWILATIRSDFYHRCGELAALARLKDGDGQYDLHAPTAAEISQMIRMPARAAGIRFEEDVFSKTRLDDLLRDAATKDPSSLPLLEFTLQQLWERRTDECVLTHDAYRDIGGMEGALAQQAERVYASLDRRVQTAFSRVFRALVTVGMEGDDAVARKSAAKTSVETSMEGRTFVKAFTDAHLFVTDRIEDKAGGETAIVRVAHEALLRSWPRIRKWIEENKELLRIRARIATATRHWDTEGRSQDLLLAEGKPLQEARQLEKAMGEDLDDAERKFIRASKNKARRLQRTKRTAVVALFLLTLAAGVAAYFANQLRHFADQQREIAEDNENRANKQTLLADERRAEAQRITYRLYRDNYEKAKEKKKSEEAVVWLRAAIDVGRTCGIETARDESTLRAEVSFVSSVRWDRGDSPPLLYRMWQSGRDTPIWCYDDNRLYRGAREEGAWSFEKMLSDAGKVLDAAWWSRGERILAVFGKELCLVDPKTATRTTIYKVTRGDLREAVCVPAGGDLGYVVHDNRLLAFDLTATRRVGEWDLGQKPIRGVWELIVDPASQRAIVRCTVGQNDRRIRVLDLAGKGRLALDIERQGNGIGGLALHGDRCVYVSTEGELLCLGLSKEPKLLWRRTLPWKGGQVVAIDGTGFTVLHAGGVLRTWSYDGRVTVREQVPNGLEPNRMHRLPSGTWYSSGTELAHIAAGSLTAYRPAAGASGIATWDDAHLAVLTAEGIEVRRTADHALVRTVPLKADGFVADPAHETIYVRLGAKLQRYGLGEASGPAAEADAGLVDAPLLLAGKRGGVIAATKQGVYRFDPQGLGRRELLYPGRPAFTKATKDAVFFVEKNEDLGRLEVWAYSWRAGRLRRLSVAPQLTKDVTAVTFDERTGELFWGTKAGNVIVKSIAKGGATTEIGTGGEDVLALAKIDEGSLVVTRQGGQLVRYSRRGVAGYKREETMDPLQSDDVVRVLALGRRRMLARSSAGGYGLVALGGLNARRDHAQDNASGRDTVQDSGVYCCAASGHLLVRRPGKQPLRLMIDTMGSAEFSRIAVSPSRHVVLASVKSTIYCWLIKNREGKTVLRPKNLSVFTGCDSLRFLDDETFVVTRESSLGVVAISPLGEPRVRASRKFDTIPTIEYLVPTKQGFIVANGEERKLFLVDPEQGEPREFALPDQVRSLALGGPQDQYVLVGGDRRVIVFDPASWRIRSKIKVPRVFETRTTTYYTVRSSCGIRGTDVIAIGGQQNIFLARLDAKECFFRIPVAEYVWRLRHAQGRLYWSGDTMYGEVEIPDFTGPVPDMASIARLTKLRLENGELQPLTRRIRVAKAAKRRDH